MFGFGYRQKARQARPAPVDRSALIRILATVMEKKIWQIDSN
jgi:hypothetical protein